MFSAARKYIFKRLVIGRCNSTVNSIQTINMPLLKNNHYLVTKSYKIADFYSRNVPRYVFIEKSDESVCHCSHF